MSKKSNNLPDIIWCGDIELRSKIAKAKLSYENSSKKSHLDEFRNIVDDWWNHDDNGQVGWETPDFDKKGLLKKSGSKKKKG
jgi:hypothetical protein